MVDKLKYNNLIISGSKEIQKSKIQVLRKVIQKIQKLKKTVERKPDDESCKIKLRKCLAVVESAKKLKKFEALTNILLLEKCPNKIVTNSRSTPDEVAIAMLASNPTMKILITKIKEELNLSDVDVPTWRKTLMQISKQKIKTLRKKKRKQALEAAAPGKKNLKSKKKSKKDSGDKKIKLVTKSATAIQNEEIQQEDLSSKTIDLLVKNEPERPKTEIKMKKNKGQRTQLKPKTEKNNLIESKSKPPNFVVTMENSAFDEEIRKMEPKLETSNVDDNLANNYHSKAKLKKSKQNNLKNAFINDESEVLENDNSLNNIFQAPPKAKPKPKEPEIKIAKVVDPFFVTSSGESYVAIAPVIETNNEVNDRRTEKYEPKMRSSEPFKSLKSENSKMHPSWAAKQKERAPVGFQGKRKVFDDDASNQKTSSGSATNDLHPSWVAKQKLKPSITAFQGKKIKFDDE